MYTFIFSFLIQVKISIIFFPKKWNNFLLLVALQQGSRY